MLRNESQDRRNGGSACSGIYSWAATQNPTLANSYNTSGADTGVFSCKINFFSLNTTYFVRAFAINKAGTSYGNQVSFNSNPDLPTVTTNAVTNISYTTVTSGGNITADGGASITARGVCFNTTGNPSIADTYTTNGTGTGNFTSSLSNLNANTTYYVKAYATNSRGTSYGSEMSFTTIAYGLPVITTTAVTNITTSSATCGGNITSDGGQSVTARGVCWSTSQNPSITNSHTSDGTGTGTFSSSINGLNPGTTYYVRAFATNNNGTTYGNQVQFASLASLPTVITNAISNITATTATGGGNVTYDGGSSITARGICWSTSQNPVITDSHTTDGTGTGTFSSSIIGLSPSITHYVRAYATNSIGTSYGNQISFTTMLAIGDNFQGGIVAYILQSGDPGYNASVQHGLIAAPSDQSTGAQWGCNGTVITGADGTAIGTGAQNTNDIVLGCATSGIAAKLCSDLVLGGYSDWYLPSKDELNKLYLNRGMVGGFTTNYYWSSSEFAYPSAWGQLFSGGNQGTNGKGYLGYVRAVRTF